LLNFLLLLCVLFCLFISECIVLLIHYSFVTFVNCVPVDEICTVCDCVLGNEQEVCYWHWAVGTSTCYSAVILYWSWADFCRGKMSCQRSTKRSAETMLSVFMVQLMLADWHFTDIWLHVNQFLFKVIFY